MNIRYCAALIPAMLLASPALAHPPAGGGAPKAESASGMQTMDHSQHAMAKAADTTSGEPQAVLAAYRTALESRDAAAMTALFAKDSLVFENGKAEGSFANYMEHHLGPELADVKSFTFSDPKIAVTVHGDMAMAHESYGYRIALADGRVVERTGVATSVLVQRDGRWLIVRYHSSSRAPR